VGREERIKSAEAAKQRLGRELCGSAAVIKAYDGRLCGVPPNKGTQRSALRAATDAGPKELSRNK
jgi:hypothetical protein